MDVLMLAARGCTSVPEGDEALAFSAKTFTAKESIAHRARSHRP